MRRLVLISMALGALLFTAQALGAGDPCVQESAGEHCEQGHGLRTPGGKGTGKVSHAAWPPISGVIWKVHEGPRAHDFTGGGRSDELMGHHGDDTVLGGPGADVLWGDWDPAGNPTSQHDVLRGQGGDDFLYPSHGRSRVFGGPGDDYVWAYYGRGTIDCGPGKHDVVHVRANRAWKLKSCESVKHTF